MQSHVCKMRGPDLSEEIGGWRAILHTHVCFLGEHPERCLTASQAASR